jgi:uncharacterized protein YfdQ (DUF2303 family)
LKEVKDCVSGSAVGATGQTDVGAAIEAVRALHGVSPIGLAQQDPGGVSLVSLPSGMRLVDVTADLDARRDGPRRVKGTERAHTLDAFIDLVKRHKRGGTAVWADGGAPSLTAVIDYHASSIAEAGPTPAWCDHKVVYQFPFTEAFGRWRSARAMSQREFLKFVQDCAREIVDPEDLDLPPAGTLVRDTMLDVLRSGGRPRAEREKTPLSSIYGNAAHLVEVAKRMSSKTGSSVKEVDRGLGGITVTFEDEKRVEGTENAREYYLIEVEVFRGSGRCTMPARLKAEATDGGLVLGLELVGVDCVVESAFSDAIKRVGEETGCPIYQGVTG